MGGWAHMAHNPGSLCGLIFRFDCFTTRMVGPADMAHNPEHPSRIAFAMLEGPPAGEGGETVLTDMRWVTRTLRGDARPTSQSSDNEATLFERDLIEEIEKHGGIAYQKRLWSAANVSHSFTWQKRYFVDASDQNKPFE